MSGSSLSTSVWRPRSRAIRRASSRYARSRLSPCVRTIRSTHSSTSSVERVRARPLRARDGRRFSRSARGVLLIQSPSASRASLAWCPWPRRGRTVTPASLRSRVRVGCSMNNSPCWGIPPRYADRSLTTASGMRRATIRCRLRCTTRSGGSAARLVYTPGPSCTSSLRRAARDTASYCPAENTSSSLSRKISAICEIMADKVRDTEILLDRRGPRGVPTGHPRRVSGAPGCRLEPIRDTHLMAP